MIVISNASSHQKPAINKDDRSKDGGNKLRAGEGRGCVPKPMMDIGRPEDHGNGESEAQPKLVTKHSDRVSGVTVVVSVGPVHFANRHVGPPVVRGLHVSFSPFELSSRKLNAVVWRASIRQTLRVQPIGRARVSTLAQTVRSSIASLNTEPKEGNNE